MIRGLVKAFAGVDPGALAAGAAAIALAAGIAGAAAGWTVNGWRLGVELEAVQRDRDHQKAQGAVTADALGRCNAGVDAVDKAGKAMTAATAALVKAAKDRGSKYEGELAAIHDALKKPTPTKPGGQKADCGDAWRKIERRAQP